MTAAPPNLSLRDVTKRYGAMRAADRVSLEIPGGSFFSLLGPSGSGKTTLLMIIAGFVMPEEGEVTLGERILTRIPPERRDFGMVFQGYALFPNLSVAGNVAFPLEVRRLGRAERDSRVRAALDLVRLSGLADRMPKQLSGGQQQRVALARALVFEPEILLLDEPLSALDKKLRAGLQVELRDLQRRLGKTFICVTHDQEEALSMSDGIAIVRDGRIAQTGAPRALFDRPATHFVADFLGESNFIHGVAGGIDERGRQRYRAGDQWLAQAGPHAPSGEKLLISLRPFKIELHPAEPAAADNQIRGALAGWTYRGADLCCDIETSIGRMSVSCPTWRARFSPEPGQDVWLSWAADASVVVADDR